MEEITKELEQLLLTIMRQRTSLLDWEVHQSTVGISTAPETAPSLPHVHYHNYSLGKNFVLVIFAMSFVIRNLSCNENFPIYGIVKFVTIEDSHLP